jgi:hypothetical protein
MFAGQVRMPSSSGVDLALLRYFRDARRRAFLQILDVCALLAPHEVRIKAKIQCIRSLEVRFLRLP